MVLTTDDVTSRKNRSLTDAVVVKSKPRHSGQFSARGDGREPTMGKNKRCRHDRQKTHCKDCNPCPHGRVKYFCAGCNPCPHGRVKQDCKDCNPCPHGKLKRRCKHCNPCPHGKLKHNCVACNPCPHEKLRYACMKCKVLKREVKEEVAVEAAASPTAAALESAAGDRQYLNETVVPILHDGMLEMVRRRPEGRLESVKFLIAHLQAYLREHGSA